MSSRVSVTVDSHQEGASAGNKKRSRDSEEEEEKRDRGGPSPARRLRSRLEIVDNKSEDSESETGGLFDTDSESEEEDIRGGCGPAEKFAVKNLNNILEDLENIKKIERKVNYVKTLVKDKDKNLKSLKKEIQETREETAVKVEEVEDLKNKILVLERENNSLKRYKSAWERSNSPRWNDSILPSCQEAQSLIARGEVLALSEPFLKAINHQLNNSDTDWLDYYLDHLAPDQTEVANFEAISSNLDRIHKLQQIILDAEESDNKEEILKEVLGLSRIEELCGVRSGAPVRATLTVEPRILPRVGEVIVIRRESGLGVSGAAATVKEDPE